jgi:peptidoglycan/LPS O-acetylase OafA/YrhL
MRAPVRKIADIEILRAFAILFVVIYHADQNLFHPGQWLDGMLRDYFGGWVGVDLFFAISGFVIARALIPVLDSTANSPGFRHQTLVFWGRRALRLLPSAWLWLILILLLQLLFNQTGVFGSARSNLWATAAGMFNFANFRFADSFLNYDYGASFVYWSLSLEEQFYLLLPVIFFFFRKYTYALLIVLIAWQLPFQRSTYELVLRSDAISLGILIAAVSNKQFYQGLNPANHPLLRKLFTAAAVFCLALLPFIGSYNQSQIGFQVGAVAVLSGLVVFCCSFDANLLARLPGSRVLLWIGARSYALYLIHIPAFYMVREFAARTGLELMQRPGLTVIAAFAFLFALAELNYRFIEKPVSRVSERLFGRTRVG